MTLYDANTPPRAGVQDIPAQYDVVVQYNVQIPVRGGLSLSANLFMPVPQEPGERFPAILEMIPYRKDGWRFSTDHALMTYFAERGYVGCRLDIRGTGSSPGIAYDEYTPEETQDGYDVVEWLAAQPWCSGQVGMWGISYGGFTSIQVAMLQPPSLKAIIPVYATDDRYTDDVHYIGGCKTVSEMAQYAVSQIAMNALPPRTDYVGSQWAALWRQRLEETPPWLIKWLENQTDGPYWRNGSLAPDYERIQCAMLLIGGWHDSYVNSVFRMLERCTASRKAIIGNWTHQLPHYAYPGPTLDWLHESICFLDYWLKDINNGVMTEPALTFFRHEYTEPTPFPVALHGSWQQATAYPLEQIREHTLYLGAGTLQGFLQPSTTTDHYPHRPTLGTHGSLCYGGGSIPNGLARDLRPDEAHSLTYTSEPLTEAVDILGFVKAQLYLRATAPVAHVIVRLTDVAPDGTSAQVTVGVLNLTHRASHSAPAALDAETVYPVTVPMRATGYRFLPGHRIRLSVASAWWPVIWPSPYPGDNYLYRGADYPSRLLLPIVPAGGTADSVRELKETPPHLQEVGEEKGNTPLWQIIEDVLRQSVTVKAYGGGESILPNGIRIFDSELLEMTAYHHDPARVLLYNEVLYQLDEVGYHFEVRTTGTTRSTENDFHIDIQLRVLLNGNPFFEKTWLESFPRQLL